VLPASAVTCDEALSAGEVEYARPGSTRSKVHPLCPLPKGSDPLARENANGKISPGTASRAARQCTGWPS